jgi:hypothetical protein
MIATRKLDWAALAARLGRGGRPAAAAQASAG